MNLLPIGGLLNEVSQATVFLSPDIHVLMGLRIFWGRYVIEAVFLRVLRALPLLEKSLQIFPCMRGLIFRNLLRRSFATSVPPPSPPFGPMSMIQSAVSMTFKLCSMTITVLPWSRRVY